MSPTTVASVDEVAVAEEVGDAVLVEDRPVRAAVRVADLVLGRVLLGALPLLGHQPAEAVLVDREPLLGGHLQGQVDREPVRVVQLERLVAGEHRAARPLGLRGRQVEDPRAAGERGEEGVLLVAHHGPDAVELGDQLGVGRAHRVAHDGRELRQHRLADAEQAHGADDAAQQPAQHVAARLVARGHAVADQHHAAARVVRDDPEPHVVDRVGAVAAAGHLLRLGDHRADEVGLVDVVDVLEQERDALYPQPGVDVLGGQLTDRRVVLLRGQLAALVLHEDEVPDLEVAVLVDDRAAVLAELRAAVVVDLRAGAAGTGHAHVPVVVVTAAALDALVGQAGDLAPQLDGLVVGLVDGDPDALGVEAVAALGLAAGDQLPRVLDRAGLEVVAEGEVPGHLEERVVPGGLADLVDVAGAHALLHAGRARVRRRLLAEEVRLELHHPRVDEQQVRVVEDERRAGHERVPRVREVVEEALADLVCLHGVS